MEEWLLIGWPPGESEPTKYWLSTLPDDITFPRLVDLAKLRWRRERDYQDLKQKLRLGQFEGHAWRGFHHHATLCIAAYGFLISERETIPPSGLARSRLLATCGTDDYRPRGRGFAAASRTAHPKLDRNDAPRADRRHRRPVAAMPMLRSSNGQASPEKFVTQYD